ncbi:MAG: ABC transporter substrate-binding protein [Deltaproteobacteria bacterium]|nr:ABC transporter substrate-binding protein [Deltaproteobacteria bacterium]
MPAIKLTDDLGRTLVFVHPPARIVSLVPSDTYSLIALGAVDRLVGRTTYCESPEVAHLPTVGGTKDVDVDAVFALAPHLVIANQEENTRVVLEALAARVPVLVSLPRRVNDGIAHLARLARILGVGPKDPARALIKRAYALRDRTVPSEVLETPPDGLPVIESQRRSKRETAPRPDGRVRAFIPIWNNPLMTMNADTFGSDVLVQCGIANVFGQRLRLYPLAADLGKSAPQDSSGRDVRYPRLSLFEIKEREPDLVILPDEPYNFTEAEEQMFRDALPKARIVRVSGKDLFWYGAWTIDALDRLNRELAQG